VFPLALLGAGVLQASEARAGAGADSPKYHVEARFMFWGDASGRQSIPGQQQRIDDFFIRRARLVFDGRPTESITLYVQLGQDNVAAKVLTEDGSIRIKDAYLTYRAAGALQFTAGQFKIPFLRANLESGFNQVLVDRGSLGSQRPAREGSRDLGVMAWGNMAGLQYRVALYDGSDQEAANARSGVRSSTRVAYNWFANERGLGYTGSYLGTTRVLHVAAQLDIQGSRLDARDESGFQSRPRDYRAYALEAFFEQPFARASALTVDGAWFDRQDDYVESGVATRQLRGYYVQSAFLLPGEIGFGRLQFAFRREAWDAERGPVDRRTTRTTAGATYYLKGHSRKVQTDYTRKHEAPEISNDELRVSVALVF
jgi:hypothetical protein